MFANARKSVQEQLVSRNVGHLSYESIHVLSNEVPQQYTARQLCTYLTGSIEKPIGKLLESLVILETCLQHSESLIREKGDLGYAKSLILWVSIFIRPTGDLIIGDDSAEAEQEAAEVALAHSLFVSRLGIKIICNIIHIFQVEEADLDFEVLLSLVAFTDARDRWTSDSAHIAVTRILDDHAKKVQGEEFIVEGILNGFIRPLFSRSKPAAISAKGRKAINPDNAHPRDDLDPLIRPWKFQQISAVTIFAWAVGRSDESTVYNSWHLFIPPLLTLLDDSSTAVRIRGLEISKTFLGKTSAKVLKQTGLGEVFEDAIMPTLHFLPSLTPEDESVRLLRPAYEVLFKLGDVLFLTKEQWPEKMKFLDRIMRQGLLQGIEHCRDNVKIIEVLLGELNGLISRMGIHSVKHLKVNKDIVPILSATLSNPFGPSHPEILFLAAKATQTTIINCWPRMRESVYRLEILKALCLCWTNINEDAVQHEAELASVKDELQVTGTLLARSVDGARHIGDELTPLLAVDETLGKLFGLHEASRQSKD